MAQNQRRELNDGTGRTCLVDGSVVGGYETSLLAAGGMSVVYKGSRDGQTFVLKEVEAKNTRDVPSLMSEKSLLERLDHPGLVSQEALFNEGGYYYLVVEFVDGKPLATFLDSDQELPVERVLDWGIQLAEIFAYLHSRNPPVIYRDLKPENILLAGDTIKLIDFGIARLHKGGKQSDTALFGSPVTASPEHYGGAETDARSDIYTMGATLFELLTGGEQKRIGAFEFPPLRDVRANAPADVEAVLAKALEMEPEERFQNATEFRNALLKCARRPIPPSDSAPPNRVKSKMPLVLVALLVLLAVVGFGSKNLGQKQVLYGGTPEGLKEANLEGDLFVAGEIDDRAVVLLGEDIGLFQVNGWREQSAEERAGTLSKRLNGFYHQFCSLCGKSKLEPEDVKVGRYEETKDLVVFYAHQHEDGAIFAGPLVLATVTQSQADELGVAPRFVAACWRDLLRDTVQLSRGFAVHQSPLGEELKGAFQKARAKLRTGEVSIGNLRKILREVTGAESLHLQRTFLQIPDAAPTLDKFNGIKGYVPLKV